MWATRRGVSREWAEAVGPKRVAAVLTPHEQRIIGDALAAGRVTVLRPGVAEGLTEIERRFHAGWVNGDLDAVSAAATSNRMAQAAMRRRERLGSEGVQ